MAVSHRTDVACFRPFIDVELAQTWYGELYHQRQ
jgi:hypothetical protein